MAVTINDTTYSGKAASPWLVKATTDFATVNKGLIYVADTVRKKLTIPRFAMDSLIQDRAATPASAGTGTVDGQVITPQDFMVYWEFNPRDFETHWEAEVLSDLLIGRRLSAEAEAVILGEVSKYVNSRQDFMVWRSRTSNTNDLKYYNGLIKKMLDDSDVIDIATPVTLTSGNIEDKLEAVKDAIPDSIYDHPDFKYIVNVKTAKLWADAQRTATYKGSGLSEAGVMQFDGRPVVAVPGLHDDTILGTYASNGPGSNLWMGINSAGDESLVQLDFLQANSELMFVKMLMKADVNYGWGSEIVLYTTQTA